MADFLKSRVFGQDDVIDAVVEILTPKLLGLDARAERPNGVLLFAGPAGVGKTELARSIAEFVHGTREKLLRFDMSEFSEPHSVSKIVGAPDPIFECGGRLVDRVAENPSCVLLLEEIEKAHPRVQQLFLRVFDTGVLTDYDGRCISFSDVVVVMTANIQECARRGPAFGSETERESPRITLRRYLTPELLNRSEYVGVFRDLRPEIVWTILEKRVLPELQERLRRDGIELEVPPEAMALIAERGFDEKSGARALERLVDGEILSSVARLAVEGWPHTSLRLWVDVSDGSFAVREMEGGNR